MSERIPAEVFPPGEFIKEELEAFKASPGRMCSNNSAQCSLSPLRYI